MGKAGERKPSPPHVTVLPNLLVAFPHLFGLREGLQVREPRMRLEVFGVLLELAAHRGDGRHDLLDVAFELGRDAVVGRLERRVDGFLTQGDGCGFFGCRDFIPAV